MINESNVYGSEREKASKYLENGSPPALLQAYIETTTMQTFLTTFKPWKSL